MEEFRSKLKPAFNRPIWDSYDLFGTAWGVVRVRVEPGCRASFCPPSSFRNPKPPSSVCGPFSPSQQYTAIQQQQKQDITDKRATRSTDSAGQYRQRRTICPSCLLCDVRRTCATCSSVLPVLSCPLCCTCASKTLRKPVARSTTK